MRQHLVEAGQGGQVATVKRIVCLANSRKPGGSCVAGCELRGGGRWIRPIGDRPGEEVWSTERRYDDGSEPALLDIIDIPVHFPRPNAFQPENWVIDSTRRWGRVGASSTTALAGLVRPAGPLWFNGTSSGGGLNDRIPEDRAAGLGSSLALIEVPSLQLEVSVPGRPYGDVRRRVRGRFEWAGDEYGIWVTDPSTEDEYAARGDGFYEMRDVFLTISLATPIRSFSYKLVAAVIPKHPVRTAA
jgi:hypothetical protein